MCPGFKCAIYNAQPSSFDSSHSYIQQHVALPFENIGTRKPNMCRRRLLHVHIVPRFPPNLLSTGITILEYSAWARQTDRETAVYTKP